MCMCYAAPFKLNKIYFKIYSLNFTKFDNFTEAGKWSEWAEFSKCSAECGNGTITRKRMCKEGFGPNKDCEGPETDEIRCALKECEGKTFSFHSNPIMLC